MKSLPIQYTLEYGLEVSSPRTGKTYQTSIELTHPDSADSFPAEGDLVVIDGIPYRVIEIDIEEEDVTDGQFGPYHSVFCSATVVRS